MIGSDGDHRSARLRGQQYAGDTGHGDAAPPRDLSSCRLVDEQEPGVELLGQGYRFRFADVEKLAELQHHPLIRQGVGRRASPRPKHCRARLRPPRPDPRSRAPRAQQVE